MNFTPDINITKDGDRITISMKQKYMARGRKRAYRWRIAGIVSLKELIKREQRTT